MTPEDLRDARMAEARRLTLAEGEENLNPLCVEAFANHLCDLIEQDWRPEPEVDAATLAAREWMKGYTAKSNDNIEDGVFDECPEARAFRAGHAHAQATSADVRRMDWLERHRFEVENDSDLLFGRMDPKLPLRTKIDRAMEGGQ